MSDTIEIEHARPGWHPSINVDLPGLEGPLREKTLEWRAAVLDGIDKASQRIGDVPIHVVCKLPDKNLLGKHAKLRMLAFEIGFGTMWGFLAAMVSWAVWINLSNAFKYEQPPDWVALAITALLALGSIWMTYSMVAIMVYRMRNGYSYLFAMMAIEYATGVAAWGVEHGYSGQQSGGIGLWKKTDLFDAKVTMERDRATIEVLHRPTGKLLKMTSLTPLEARLLSDVVTRDGHV